MGSTGHPMMRTITWLAGLTGALAALVPFSMLVGLGIHRHASPGVISASALVLTFGPAVAVGLTSGRQAGARAAGMMWAWAAVLYLVLPVYFPGERRQAVATGLAVAGFGTEPSDRIAGSLPAEPEMATPEVAEAARLTVEAPLPQRVPLAPHEIALPYEGEGRRMSVPVIFGNRGHEIEVDMMLDTGATYTTLSHAMLARLGASPTDADPVIRLHTANGEREAQVVLLDSVWLGDLELSGVAIATCDDCASVDTAGLLGLNVAGGYNLAIDADRQEVVFSRRATFDRRLDVKPFTDLSAMFTRFPGGRVEVAIDLDNHSRRTIARAVTAVQCGDATWTVPVTDLAPGEMAEVRRRLPRHEPCEQYQIALHEADW